MTHKYKTGDYVTIYGVKGRCKIIDVDDASDTPECYLVRAAAHAFIEDRWWSEDDIAGLA